METRSSQKRKGIEGKQVKDSEPPAKRTRSQVRQPQAPASPPRSARSQRTSKQRTNRSKSTFELSASGQAAKLAQRAEDAAKLVPAKEEPAPPPNPCEGQAVGSMDASGRRGSRSEAPSGGADEERDHGDVFGRNLGAAGNALQGLLRKLGANFEDMLPMGMSSMRVKNIVAGMKQFDDETSQLSSLTELCELLSISTEESLTSFPVEQVVPLLVQLLGMEHNPDIMLLAARALTFMADVVPTSCSTIVRHGAVPAFCARLLTIEYIDLAEQSLQALEKISHEHPHALLQNGGLMAVLSYLDFFPTGVQRTAVATAATMCTGLGPAHLSAVKDALPVLCNLLQYQDAKVVDNACLALLHIAEAYSKDASLLDQLQTAGLINQALQLISINGSSSSATSTQTSVATYFGMVKLLSTCASGSAAIAQQLLKAGVVDTLRQLLANCSMLNTGSSSAGATSVLRTPDQLFEVMNLVFELLPGVPDASDMLMRDLPMSGSAQAADERVNGSAAAPAGNNQPSNGLADFLSGAPEMVMTICSSLLPLSLQVYSSTVMPNVRSRCLSVIVKLLAIASPSQLQSVLAVLPISSFVAGLLAGRDAKAQAVAIQMAEILMSKLPQIFASFFVKEGVAHALERLASSAANAGSSARASDPGTAVAAAAAGANGVAGGRRSSSGGGLASHSELPPPSPPVTRSRRPSRADSARDESRQQPIAPAAAPATLEIPTGIEGMRIGSFTLRNAVAHRAAAFQKKHFSGSGPGGAAAGMESEGLKQLKQLCSQLTVDHTCIRRLLETLTSTEVSVFEMITSGAVYGLTAYLQGADLAVMSSSQDEQLLCRLRHFTAAALTAHSPSSPDIGQQHSAGAAAAASVSVAGVPLTLLVRKLQTALASSEAFPVLCSRLSGGGGAASGSAARSLSRSAGAFGSFNSGSLTSGLAALTQPFKLRLVRHPEESVLKEYPANIVLIEPLANMSAIEDFLWPRVNRGSTTEALRAKAAETFTTAGDSSKAVEASAGAGRVRNGSGQSATGSAGAAATGHARSSSGTAGNKVAPASKTPAPSRAQPIPDADGGNGRMTRAQAARARAEAQARAEAAAQQRQARWGAAEGSSDPLSDEHDVSDEDMMMRDHMSSEHDDDHMHDSDDEGDDHDMLETGAEEIFDHDDDDDDDDDDEEDEDEDMHDADLAVGSMPVHNLHLAEGWAASTAAVEGGAASSSAAAANGSVINRPTASVAALHTAGAATASQPRAPWARSPAGPAVAAGSSAASGAARTAAAVAAAAASRILFYINGRPLASTTTVFQAIQQSVLNADGGVGYDAADDETAGLSGNGRRGRQLWDHIYTLSYRLGGTEQATAALAAGCQAGAGAEGTSSRQGSLLPNDSKTAAAAVGECKLSHWRHSPLGELLAIKLPGNLAAPESCLDILRLIQLLEVVNRLAPRLLASQELQLLQTSGSTSAVGGALQEGAATAVTGVSSTNVLSNKGQGKATTAEDDEALGIALGEAAAGQMALAHVSRDEFISSKLGNKLAQQLKDVLSICGGGIPAWCHQLVVSCKFLFPFEVRRCYFYSTAFGLGRALHHMHQQQAAEGVGGALERDGRELRIGRLQRQKVRVSRKRILESAIKVMELYAKHRAVLELEYFNEVGTGLGPTLEFYTMLSHELQKKHLGMWRHEDPPEQQPSADVEDVQQPAAGGEVHGEDSNAGVQQQQDAHNTDQTGQGSKPSSKSSSRQGSRPPSRGGPAADGVAVPSVRLHQEVISHEQAMATAAEYVYAPHGLFPLPLEEQQQAPGTSVVEYFRLLGRSVAKALQDNRLLDLPLSPVFFKAALGKPLDIYDVARVDPGLGSSLEKLAKAAAAHAAGGGKGAIAIDGCSIDDLCLTFTLPGNATYELRPSGADVLVDSSNLVEYIQAIVDATLGAGIAAQIKAFREGFNEVFTLAALEVFYEDEMEVLLCGAGEHWSPQQLADSMKFDHGYTAQSIPVRHLLEILSELDPSDQRRFLRFVTGCPRLPPGGIAALQPRLTVVRKHPSLLPPSDGPTPGTTPCHSSMDWSNGTPLADGDLPSVMTCANYIKLPPYSCKDVMRERIMFAIKEGQGSFDLS